MGTIFDVAVDLRKHSKTFGEWVGTEISAINKRQLWIPIGFAHGFLTLSEHAEVSYKATGYWNKNCEHSIRWNDKKLNINWPTMHLKTNPILSEKDKIALYLRMRYQKEIYSDESFNNRAYWPTRQALIHSKPSFAEIIPTTRSELDLANENVRKQAVQFYKPDWIINWGLHFSRQCRK